MKHKGHYVTNTFVINTDRTEEVDTSDSASDYSGSAFVNLYWNLYTILN